MYEHSYGLYSSGVLSHNYGLQFAVSSTTPPASNELLMTMGQMSGVSINHSLDVSSNLQVHGACTFNGNASINTLTVGGANIGSYDFITESDNFIHMDVFTVLFTVLVHITKSPV